MPRAACVSRARFLPSFMVRATIPSPSKWIPSRSPGFSSPRPATTPFSMSKSPAHPAAKAMIVDWQREPIKDKLIHIDMKRIALDKTLRVSVRVKLLGVPVGVKTAGGILDQVLREVEIECLPADIPSHIDVDVSELAMHGVLACERSAALGQDQVPECRRRDRCARRLDS